MVKTFVKMTTGLFKFIVLPDKHLIDDGEFVASDFMHHEHLQIVSLGTKTFQFARRFVSHPTIRWQLPLFSKHVSTVFWCKVISHLDIVKYLFFGIKYSVL